MVRIRKEVFLLPFRGDEDTAQHHIGHPRLEGHHARCRIIQFEFNLPMERPGQFPGQIHLNPVPFGTHHERQRSHVGDAGHPERFSGLFFRNMGIILLLKVNLVQPIMLEAVHPSILDHALLDGIQGIDNGRFVLPEHECSGETFLPLESDLDAMLRPEFAV